MVFFLFPPHRGGAPFNIWWFECTCVLIEELGVLTLVSGPYCFVCVSLTIARKIPSWLVWERVAPSSLGKCVRYVLVKEVGG